jgi:hypothetical protein
MVLVGEQHIGRLLVDGTQRRAVPDAGGVPAGSQPDAMLGVTPEWPPGAGYLAGAVAVIHDFDIGHPRFSFDAYGGLACGPGLLEQMSSPPSRYFILDPAAVLPLPCLQTGR